jgi:small-conductance mechanosensitive channel
LAIGFGSQALVKDVVSGLFLLVNDAFRSGEFIETSGTKGTVEKISTRSVTLRNSSGSVATVPYGQMGKIHRAKFKTKPGKQSEIRRAALKVGSQRLPRERNSGRAKAEIRPKGNAIA